MIVLLDTHAFLWFIMGSASLSVDARAPIEDPANKKLLNINVDHLAAVTILPFHHRDPFDRLIIAQSVVEKIPVVSIDAAFDAYGPTRFW
jgi:PIN domain nuclease of toxin-antitoxin system